MSEVNVNIDKAEVTQIREFCSSKGYGIDIYVTAKSSDCTVYLQIVLYDERARKGYNIVHVGDILTVKGILKVKNYPKNDGTTGWSLTIENPEYLCQVQNSSNSIPQLPQQTEDNKNRITEANACSVDAVSASAVSADEPAADNPGIKDRVADTKQEQDAGREKGGVRILEVHPFKKLVKYMVDGQVYESYSEEEPPF